jgi:hypothetical protein
MNIKTEDEFIFSKKAFGKWKSPPHAYLLQMSVSGFRK